VEKSVARQQVGFHQGQERAVGALATHFSG
jgi:hypothetical protein